MENCKSNIFLEIFIFSWSLSYKCLILSRPVGNVKMNVVWGKPTTEMKMKALVAEQRNALMTFPKDPPMESNHNE